MSVVNTNFLQDAIADNIFYDRQAKRYRYKGKNKPGEPITGSFVSREKAITLQKQYLEKITSQFQALAPRIKVGEIGVYKDAAELLKKIHLSNAIIAANGIDKLTNSQLGKIGNILKQQYYAGKDLETGSPFGLKHLFREIATNPNISETKIKQRLGMYALSGEISGDIIRQSNAMTIGATLARRVLGIAEHCEDCIRFAAMGWQPIGTLPLPKQQCRCRTNCKCHLEFQ